MATTFKFEITNDNNAVLNAESNTELVNVIIDKDDNVSVTRELKRSGREYEFSFSSEETKAVDAMGKLLTETGSGLTAFTCKAVKVAISGEGNEPSNAALKAWFDGKVTQAKMKRENVLRSHKDGDFYVADNIKIARNGKITEAHRTLNAKESMELAIALEKKLATALKRVEKLESEKSESTETN